MMKFSFGEMKSADGSALRYEAQAKLLACTRRISNEIALTPLFKEIEKKLPSEKVLLYFQSVIRDELRPFIYYAVTIQWLKRNNRYLPSKASVIKIPRFGIFTLLEKYWDIKDVPLHSISALFFNLVYNPLFKTRIKSHVEKYAQAIGRIFGQLDKKRSLLKTPHLYGIIACHYNEGIDLSRRNDLSWFLKSQINPERVLFYFDHIYSTPPSGMMGKLVKKDIIRWIEKQGFKWVALEKNVIEGQGSSYWMSPRPPKDFLIDKNIAKNRLERWVTNIGNRLFERVYYWRSFYDEFNIKLNYIPEEGFSDNVAQAIAFDIDKEKPGLLIGKQRSESYPLLSSCIGFHPKHVFFVWNHRAEHYLKENHDKIKMLVISGYPYRIIDTSKTSHQDMVHQLRSQGAKFIIALFDSTYTPHSPVSKNEILQFYQAFLQWALEDASIGLIIKSKKPYVIENLHSLHTLLNKVMMTKRCVIVEDVLNRLPSESLARADIAIGIGISSAIIEAAIAGSRGIHYDTTRCKEYEFYRWGRGLVIFNELDKLMFTLKRYKENSRNEPRLGDWSDHISELDPFNDKKGGERMGEYMGWLLESFDKEADQDEAICYANKHYIEKWGEDKVIDMTKEKISGYAGHEVKI
jgi:hypothetical protein